MKVICKYLVYISHIWRTVADDHFKNRNIEVEGSSFNNNRCVLIICKTKIVYQASKVRLEPLNLFTPHPMTLNVTTSPVNVLFLARSTDSSSVPHKWLLSNLISLSLNKRFVRNVRRRPLHNLVSIVSGAIQVVRETISISLRRIVGFRINPADKQ